jgi:D-alanine-D-alanine ligase
MDAFMISGCSGWGRVDILQAEDGSFYAIEINTVPGMTSHSLFPKAASLAGISSDVLLEKIMKK